MALIWFKWLLGFMMTTAHPLYISVTEINHNATDKTLEISCKIFVEDMEEVLKKSNKGTVDLSEGKNVQQNNKMIDTYVKQHLSLMADGKNAPLQFVGYEKEKESVYCYFEVVNIPAVKKLDLTNSLLHDLTDQQINIMHVTVKGERKSLKLDHAKKQATFSF
jgi:hypothetical protein